jgi:hypothetical protein
MTFFILPLLSARDLDIGPEGRYQSRADDKGNMKKATGKLYHLRLRVECTLFVICKAGREPTPYWW